MQFPAGCPGTWPENRGISTFWFQCLKEVRGNCMRHCGGIMADCSGRRLAASWVWLLWAVFRDGLVRESALRWKNPRGGVGGLVWFCGPGVLRVVGCYWWCCVLVPKCSPLRLKWVFLAVFGRGGLRFEHIGVLAALRCLPCGPEVTVGSGAASLADRLITYPRVHYLSA